MKILYFLPVMHLGGTEKHVIRLAQALRHRGHDAGIVAVLREGILAEEVRASGIPFTSLEAGEHWRPRAFRRILDLVHSDPPDILHTYLFGFHLFAGLPARILKVPVILSSRRDVELSQKRRHLWLENLGNLFVDRVICCSQAVERWVCEREAIQPEKVLTLYNGVDLRVFNGSRAGAPIRKELGIPLEAPLIGTVANFSLKKGYPYLLKAFRQVLERRPETWCLLVGAGPLEEEIWSQAKEIPGPPQIIFTGARSDIPDLLAAMDLFVFTSLWEGLPNVLLEAMAMGRPVVTTPVGGIPELIEPGVDGVLVPPKDENALAQAMLSLLADRGKALRMGEKAQEKIHRDFSMKRMVGQYEALYHSLLEEKFGKSVRPVAEVPS